MNYTKGEWKVQLGCPYNSIESEHQTICTNVSSGDSDLISAAPDMYEALITIISYELELPAKIIQQAHNAVLKAERKE